MSHKLVRTLALAVSAALVATACRAQIFPPMSAGPPPLTPFTPVGQHLTIPQGPNGEFSLGDPVNPLVVSYSPTAGPLEKWLMPNFDQNGDGQIDVGDFFQFISNPILLQEHLIVGPGQPWTDWHERIVGNDWVWTSAQLTTPGPPPGPTGLIVQNSGTAVDFFFDPIAPGTPVDITKQLQFVGMPTPAMIADFVDRKFMIRIVEYPTSVPEPSSLLLATMVSGIGFSLARCRFVASG